MRYEFAFVPKMPARDFLYGPQLREVSWLVPGFGPDWFTVRQW